MSDLVRHLRTANAKLAIVNADTRAVVARRVQVAATRAARRRGLLAHPTLASSTAMVLAPCLAVHTIGMRFAIDVLFVSRRGRVLKIVHDLRPGRMTARLDAQVVVEFAAGTLRACHVHVGDRLLFVPAG